MFRITILCQVFTGLLVVAGYGDHIYQLTSGSNAVKGLINKMILVLSVSIGFLYRVSDQMA